MKKIKVIILIIFLFFVNCSFVFAEQYSNYSNSSKLFCGGSASNALITNIPSSLPRIIHIVYFFIQVAAPILLVILGTIDLLRAIIAGKEDDIKKNQMVFIRRLAMAVLIFFILSIAKLLVNAFADGNKQGIVDCMDCFLNNNVNKDSNQCGGI